MATMLGQCADINGYLAEINSGTEYNFIIQFLKNQVETIERSDAMLGATNDNPQGAWMYLTSGAPLSWVSWTRQSAQHCMWIVWNADAQEGLHQYYCNLSGHSAHIVCEVETGKWIIGPILDDR